MVKSAWDGAYVENLVQGKSMKMGLQIGWSGYYIYDQLSCVLYSLVLLAWEHTVIIFAAESHTNYVP